MRYLLVLGALVALLVAVPASGHPRYAKTFPCYKRVVHFGHSGKCVKNVQWLVDKPGHRPLRAKWRREFKRFLREVPQDGIYKRKTRLGIRRMKFLLGYAPKNIDGSAIGRPLTRYMRGWRRLTPSMQVRKARRLKNLRIEATKPGRQGSCSYSSWARPSKSYILDWCRAVSAQYGGPLVIISGYRPGSITTSGNRSQHSTGDASDLGTPPCDQYRRASDACRMNYAVGNAALRVAGYRGSSLRSFVGRVGGWNILFYTLVGGDHYDHVHTGGPGYCAACRTGGGDLGIVPVCVGRRCLTGGADR